MNKKYLISCLLSAFLTIPLFGQNAKLTLNLKNVKVENVLQRVESQTDYRFSYNENMVDINRKVSISVNNENINEVLKKIFEGTNVQYSITGNQIVLKVVPKTENKKVEVKGRVLDENGESMPGATVAVEGSSIGTSTDVDGNFSISVPAGSSLKVASIGFKTQYFAINKPTNLKVVMQEDRQLLDEVVVVGYGTQKKVNLTGAVATASRDLLENRPIGNIAQGLQGLVPNLNITFNSGQPNEEAKINIRGNTSLNGGEALILVDGVEISDLSLINPQDVESISILKDASSAAIYGARAAFGVMLITTKKGSAKQKARISYSNNFSWSTPARLPEMPRADVWAEMWNKAYDYDNPGTYYFNEKFMDALRAHIADPANNPPILVDTEGIQNAIYTPDNPGWAYVGNTDWLDAFYKKAAFMQQHNVSISGGTERNRYYASVGYKDQSGIFRFGNDKYKRFNLSFNFDTKVFKWLDLGVSTRMNYIESDEPYMDNQGSDQVTWFYEVYRMFPTLSIYLPNGDFAGLYLNSGNYNVAGRMALAGRNVEDTWDQWYTGRFDIHPLKGLSIKGDYSWNRYSIGNKIHRKEMTQTFPEGRTPYLVETPNYVTNSNSNNIYSAFNVWAEYKKVFDDAHDFNIMVGYNQEEKTYSSTSYTMTDLYLNDLPVSDLAINYKTNSEVIDIWRIQGMFFRLNYNYKSRYLLELNGRYDGSSKYAKDDRWAFFPSASVGWRLSEEPFFKPLTKVVDNLKFRFSIGSLGNQVTDSNHSYMSILTGVSMDNYMMNGSIINALNIPSLPSLVSWEKVESKNLGLDFTLFKNRLSGSFDYYIRDTKGMVREITLPAVLGTSGGKKNLADMRTTGWELELTWHDKTGAVLNSPISYHVTLGLSDYQAEITKYDNPSGSLADGMYYKGQKLGEIWGYVTDGYIIDDFEADKMNYVQKFISTKWYPGDIKYKDLNGDGVIDNGNVTLSNPGDKTIIGNSTPRYRYNIQGGIEWHGLSVRVLFEGIGKRDMWTGSDQFWGFSRGIYNSNVTQYHIDNTWTYENPTAYYPRLNANGNKRSKQVQTKYLQDASYIRLKDLTIAYNLPKKWVSRIKAENINIYLSGLNLWEKTHMPPFMTPDIVDQITVDKSLQSENAGKEYAFMRSYSFGINITF